MGFHHIQSYEALTLFLARGNPVNNWHGGAYTNFNNKDLAAYQSSDINLRNCDLQFVLDFYKVEDSLKM